MRRSLWGILAGLTLLAGDASAATTCRALDANDGALILEVANRSSAKCTTMLAAAIKKRRCTKTSRGKTVEYMTQYDHRGVKGKLTTVTCGGPAPATALKCRALDVKNKKKLAEAKQKSSTKCAALLASTVKKKRCTAARKGKKIQYVTDYDHKGVKDKVTTLRCKAG